VALKRNAMRELSPQLGAHRRLSNLAASRRHQARKTLVFQDEIDALRAEVARLTAEIERLQQELAQTPGK
jgi:cell division protein FtsB